MATNYTDKELLEAMKDPTLLKKAGLQPISEVDEKELFADIVPGEDESLADYARKVNEQKRKQREFYKKREDHLLQAAEDKAGAGERDRQDREVNSFLETHPELASNKKLMGIVDPLYGKGKSLKEAYEIGCKALSLDPKTGKAPLSDEEKKKLEAGDKTKKDVDKDKTKETKTTALKTDTIAGAHMSTGKKEGDKERPKSIKEIASELSNDMAANGTNPYRGTSE